MTDLEMYNDICDILGTELSILKNVIGNVDSIFYDFHHALYNKDKEIAELFIMFQIAVNRIKIELPSIFDKYQCLLKEYVTLFPKKISLTNKLYI